MQPLWLPRAGAGREADGANVSRITPSPAAHEASAPDLTRIFDTVEFRDAYRISYLANAIVVPGYDAIQREFGIIRAEYILLVCLAHFPVLTAQDVSRIARRPRPRHPDRPPADRGLIRGPLGPAGWSSQNGTCRPVGARRMEVGDVVSESGPRPLGSVH